MQIGYNASIMVAKSRALRQAKARAVNISRQGNMGKPSGYARAMLQGNSSTNPFYKGGGGLTDTISAMQTRSNYTMIKNSSASLQDAAEKLLATGDGSLFERALAENTVADSEDGGTRPLTEKEIAARKEDVLKQINHFLDSYNTMVDRMNRVDDSNKAWYLKELKSYVSENRAALAQLGITQNFDGTLKVNKDKLSSADVEELKDVFGKKNSFGDKTSALAKSIQVSAQSGLNRVGRSYETSSPYNRYGRDADTYYGSGGWYNAKG